MFDHSRMAGLICLHIAAVAFGGPPFQTDDPEPVEYRHWEVYIASQGSLDQYGTSITAPHCEINYGIYPNVQAHLITPFELVRPRGEPSCYGYGDTELGMKVRFVQEMEWLPQVGTFPILRLPTGDEDKELGSGEVQVFIPLWLQKSWNTWKTYGGGGYWINPGSGNEDYWFFGWEAEREISKELSLGTEVFYQTASRVGDDGSMGFNVGAIINFSERDHLLLSAGKDFSGLSSGLFYIAYQLTLGP